MRQKYYGQLFLNVEYFYWHKPRKNVFLRSKQRLSEGKEAEFTVYMRKEGRITVPTEVRAALNIKEGNLVKCKIEKVRTKA